MAQKTRQQVLSRAVELVGRKDLAQRLRVTQAVLDRWVSGHARMPDHKLLTLAEILVEFAGEQQKK